MEGLEGQYGAKMIDFLNSDRSMKKGNVYNRLQSIAKKNDIDLNREALDFTSFNKLNDPALTSFGGTIKGGGLGGAVGYMLGSQSGGPGAGILGAQIGATAGTLMSSPAAAKKLLQAGYTKDQVIKKAGEAAQNMSPMNRQQYMQSIWNVMANDSDDK